MRRFSTLAAVTLLLVLAAAPHAADAQAPTEQPKCYSTSEDYINDEVIVAVQPQSPVLVKRFQAPNIRIFCVLFEEQGPDCGQASTPVLCWRPANDPNAQRTCETLVHQPGNPNHNEERGTINGPDMVWDLLWDGTDKAPQCYPRSVRFRALVLVRGKDVESLTVFIILVILAGLVLLAMLLVFLWFVNQRLKRIDEAGAVTIAGPKGEFTGPQMAVAAGNGPLGVDKVYLPVDENGATVADQSAGTYGQLANGTNGYGSATPAMRTRRGPKRASPPAPGDGLPGGAGQFRGAQRSIFGEGGDDEDDDDLYYYDDENVRRYRRDGTVAPPGTSVRRRRGGGKGGAGGGRKKGGRGVAGDDEDEMTAMGYSTLFPTEEGWRTGGPDGDEDGAYVDEDGNPIGIDEARRRGIAPPPKFGTGGRQQVRYIPQWQQGTFAKGGLIPEIGDGDLDDEGYVPRDQYGREIGKATGKARTFGRYATSPSRRSPNRRNGEGGEDDENGYGSDRSGRRTPNGGRRSGRNSPYAGSRGPNGSRGGGRRGPNGEGDDGTMGGNGMSDGDMDNFGGSRRSPNGRRGTRRGTTPGGGREFTTGGLQEAGQDNFNRSRAKFFSPKLDPNGGRVGGPGTPGGRRGADANDENAMTAVPAPMMQCAACKVVLGGPDDPPFCPVSGERHF
jgi:hypothetical protein